LIGLTNQAKYLTLVMSYFLVDGWQPIDAETHKAMLAWHYRQQEQQKVT
jgi:hypothetical protein